MPLRAERSQPTENKTDVSPRSRVDVLHSDQQHSPTRMHLPTVRVGVVLAERPRGTVELRARDEVVQVDRHAWAQGLTKGVQENVVGVAVIVARTVQMYGILLPREL